MKNTHAEILSRVDYEAKYVRKLSGDMAAHDASPAEARKLLEEAVAYAHGIGLAPYPDYPKIMVLFGDIKASDSNAKFQFGKDGKPFYLSGPNETLERSRQIVAILTNTCSVSSGFHYTSSIIAPPDEFAFPDDEDLIGRRGRRRIQVGRVTIVWCLVFPCFVTQTPNTKHQTPNTKHQTPNTKHQTPNTKHQTRNAGCPTSLSAGVVHPRRPS